MIFPRAAAAGTAIRAFTQLYAALTALYRLWRETGVRHPEHERIIAMQSKLRHLTLAVGVLLASSATFAGQAMEPPPDGNPPPPMAGHRSEPLPPFLRGVTLSEEQRDKIFEIMYAQMPAMRTREKELQQAGDTLMKLPLGPEFDDLKAKSLSDAIGRASADIALNRARADAKIYRLLTPEQRKQVGSGASRQSERRSHLGEPCGNEPPRR